MFKATMKNGKKIYFDDVSEMAKEENRLDYASMVDWCTDGHMVGLNVSPWKMAEDWERQYESDEADEDEQEEYWNDSDIILFNRIIDLALEIVGTNTHSIDGFVLNDSVWWDDGNKEAKAVIV